MSGIEDEVEQLCASIDALRGTIARRFLGHRRVVDLLLYTVLADGHALLESPPGLGKTTLVSTLAAALDLDFRRIQFTPDLMPADVIGMRVLEEDERGRRSFVQHRGPLFTNVLLADEINRATPRTQAALLEAMQERQVTLFDETEQLERPFLVIATQNPVEMEGTYPLPEAQLDRFLTRIDIESPSERALVDILAATTGEAPEPIESGLNREELLRAQALVRELPISTALLGRVAATIRRTDPKEPRSPEVVRSSVRFGASPRGGQAIVLLAKARALLEGRLHVIDEDIELVAAPALRHRLILSFEGEARGVRADDLIEAALAATKS
ncbi:AAA family ATPase [Engelhardtia mirabilis]|uniref:ATPase RavA n=1 Tax=Engelhardtia mirabilis TaxID=2528011 RepID=A0A518BDF7_9BACT|nr:ATPase RavA [Planctomycetes bacterium Pla133]QDU99331.1 ATPase RavA [Planctomycetes bacterium Pla86]